MNIFEVTADQITRLRDLQLVELLRRLLSAELTKNGIPLGAGTAPAQITIADGGEDGRVAWHKGPAKTDFLPHRYTIFQCKKSDHGPSSFKEEVWTKASQGKGKKRKLNEALAETIKRQGAYLVITGSPVVGIKVTRRIEAVEEGIREAGEDPSKLAAIEIIDANKLASWANSHPAVALWLNATLRELHLHGFRNYEDWSSDIGVSEPIFQCLEEERFLMRGAPLRQWKKDQPGLKELQSIQTFRSTLDEFFYTYGRSIRIVGPSGYGKTRFIHALFSTADGSPNDFLDSKQVVYVVYDDVKNIVVNIARELAQSGSRCILVVDDCPDEIHMRLWEAMARGNANAILITVGVETKSDAFDRSLVIEVQAASDELIEGIVRDVSTEEVTSDVLFVRELAQGFPSMALLAARATMNGDEALSSVEALISRIVWGNKEPDDEALFALQTLSLFSALGVENKPGKELEEVAEFIDRKPQSLFRLLSGFRDRGVVARLGDYAEVRPVPLAMRLANAWLAYMPGGTLERLFREISPILQLRLAGRLRWVSWSIEVSNAADRLLGELLPTKVELNTEHGSKLLDRFVHMAPDRVMEHLNNLLGPLTVDELLEFNSGRRYTVWALEKLVFRKETFAEAAGLLLKLGAGENETWGNNATGQFKSLFKMQLSGTEAEPSNKIALLDQGLQSSDLRIRQICVDALESMLTTHHFSRSSGQERIGASEPLSDWYPKTYGEIFDYYRAALARLKGIALDGTDPLQEIGLNHIGSHLRGLLQIPAIFEEVVGAIKEIKAFRPRWHRGLTAVSDWLYFDQESSPQEYRDRLRSLFDELIPDDKLERVLLYSAGWRLDLHDPDVCYDEDGGNDHHYGERVVEGIIAISPRESMYFQPVLEAFAAGTYHGAGSTLILIAMHVDDPESLINQTLGFLARDNCASATANMLRSILFGLNKIDGDSARGYLDTALSINDLAPYTVDLISSVGVDDRLFTLLIERLRDGEISPWNFHSLGIWAEREAVSWELILELIDVLLASGAEGAWAAVDFLIYSLHDKKGILANEGCLIKTVVVQATLFERAKIGHMDAYHWRELITKLFNNDLVDPGFARICTCFVTSLINVSDYTVQLDFAEYARDILGKMIDAYPEIVWEVYTDQLKSIDPLKAHRLSGLYGTEFGNPSHAGILDFVPMDIVVPWMLEDRPARLPIVLQWIKIFDGTEITANWNTEFVNFIEEHVHEAGEMSPLASRLTTGSWWGSYATKLEPMLVRLEQLAKIANNPAVSRWATQMRQSLIRAIECARRDEENRDVGFRS